MNTLNRISAIALLALSMAKASEAELFAQSGEYAEAARLYLEDIQKATNPTEALKARLNAASCLKFSGDICASLRVLGDGVYLLDEVPGETTQALFLSEMGSVISLSRHPSQAIPILNRAAVMAKKLGEDALRAEIQNDTGIACGASGMIDEAYAWYSSAMLLATKTGQPELTIRSRQNRLVSAYLIWRRDRDELTMIEEIDGWKQPVELRLTASADRFRRCFAESKSARAGGDHSRLLLFESITAGSAAVRFGMEAEGFEILRQALETARSSNAPELERSALLALAELYVAHERFDDADLLLDHMRRLSPWENPAHEAGLEILSARIAMHRKAPSAETRTRIDKAIRVVEALRSDLSASQQTSDLGRSFREWAGQPYLMLAELELRATDDKASESARNAVESFKAWELEDFYRDDCVNIVEGMTKNLAKIPDPSVAILYIIPLDSRTEILLGTSSGTKRVNVPIAEKDLSRMVRRFRHHLEFDHGTYAFMEEAHSLYDLLISPIEKALESSGIRHLVFIPDGPLGNIPLAALRNLRTGKYLLQNVSLSIAPSFSMIGAPVSDKREHKALLAGVSEAVPGFVALPAVESELKSIARIYQDNSLKLNSNFTRKQMLEDLPTGQADVIHIASHGEFRSAAGETYLLAHDRKISMDDLEQMIRPRKFTGKPVELLCLSACRTAAGDDRAALGLAGVAVKSGARSVIASLWYVDDTAAASTMVGFHRYMHSGGKSKAEALRQSQLDILAQNPLAHPYLWAPFILIGDWQ